MRKLILNAVTLGDRATSSTSYVFDLRQMFSSGDSGLLLEIAAELWRQIKDLDVKVLYGKGVGAAPLLTLMKHAACLDGRHVHTLFVRDERKERGLRRQVEGASPEDIVPGSLAIFVDDLYNTGGTQRVAWSVLDFNGYELTHAGVACVVDLWYGSRTQKALGLRVARITRRHELGLTRVDAKTPLVANTQPKWQLAKLHVADVMPTKAPPVIHFGKLYQPADDTTLYCFNPENGDLLWSKDSEKPQPKGSCCKVIADDSHIYWSAYDGTVKKADPDTGDVVWTAKLDTAVHSTPCFNADKSRLFVGTEWQKLKIRNSWNGLGDIVCLSAKDGSTIWRTPTDQMVPCSPAFNEKHDVVVCGSNDFFTYVLEAETGKIRFKLANKGEVKGTPAFSEDMDEVVTVSITGWCQCYSLLDGKMKWEKRAGRRAFHTTPVITNGLAIVPNREGSIVAFSMEDGSYEWITRIRGDAGWYVVRYSAEEILAVTNVGYCTTLRIKDGQKTRCFKMLDYNPHLKGMELMQPPVLFKDTMIVTPNNTGPICFDLLPRGE